MHKYQDTNDDVVHTYGRAHDNGEQTHLAILSLGDRDYVAVAFDVDPANYDGQAAEVVAYDPTIEGVHERTERWMQANGKGVLGGQPQGSEGGDGGSRVVEMLKRIVRGVNDYGNQQVDQMQNQNGGKQ
jgi:hypothetical protein